MNKRNFNYICATLATAIDYRRPLKKRYFVSLWDSNCKRFICQTERWRNHPEQYNRCLLVDAKLPNKIRRSRSTAKWFTYKFTAMPDMSAFKFLEITKKRGIEAIFKQVYDYDNQIFGRILVGFKTQEDLLLFTMIS